MNGKLLGKKNHSFNKRFGLITLGSSAYTTATLIVLLVGFAAGIFFISHRSMNNENFKAADGVEAEMTQGGESNGASDGRTGLVDGSPVQASSVSQGQAASDLPDQSTDQSRGNPGAEDPAPPNGADPGGSAPDPVNDLLNGLPVGVPQLPIELPPALQLPPTPSLPAQNNTSPALPI